MAAVLEFFVPIQAVITTLKHFVVAYASATCTPSGMAVAMKVW